MDEILPIEPEEEIEEYGEETDIVLATVASITNAGVTIKIDGDETAGSKVYKVNSGVLFAVNDRVKISKNSGTYLIEYPVGAPMSRYPIPSGGSDGQLLMKDGANAYQVKWASLSIHEIPSGGSSGYVLVKNSNTNYDVGWADAAVPSGGTSGQVLAKTSGTNYAVAWTTINTVPTGGTTGQVLTKNASGYGWSDPATPSTSVSKLVNGSYEVQLNSSGNLVPKTNGGASLGTSSYYFNNLYQSGDAYIGYNTSEKSIRLGTNRTKIGFFGGTPHTKVTTITTSSSLSNLIQALKDYGLL